MLSDDFGFSPFNELTATQRIQLREAATQHQLNTGETLLQPNTAADVLWVVQSGHVQLEEDGHVHVLEAGEAAGWRSLLSGHCQVHACALDPVLAWQIPKTTVLALLAENTRFSARVFSAIAADLSDNQNIDQQRELMSLMLVRVKDAYLQKPFYVDGQLDLVSVCQLLSSHKITHTLVRDRQGEQDRIGMFTTTDLRDALLHPTPAAQLPVREVARFNLISVHPEAELFDALLIMLRHRVHRVLVQDGTTILGVLSQLDLMSFVSNHSHLITLEVERASNTLQLQSAAHQVDDSVKLLQRGGMRIEIIAQLVSELNAQIFSKLWSLLAPDELQQNSCLLVLGSEGRSEQILKTDQDNALLLRDGFTCPNLAQITQQFSTALLSFGYPPCPGNIMVTNPLWCQHSTAFRSSIGQWLYGADPQGKMNLAIFMDARAVAGDTTLLTQARQYALELTRGSENFIARMASAIDQFSEPAQGWWSRLTHLHNREPESFDLKKIGTFPIVHGVRALALEFRLDALSTTERLQALAQAQLLPAALSRDLIETMHLLMSLKLRNNLRQRSLGQPISNLVLLSSLGTLERDTLQDALNIIRQFKQYLRVHYRLDAG